LEPISTIFRAYDTRGVVNETIDIEVMMKIGMGIGEFMRRRELTTILVSNDIRQSSSAFASALASGILSTGMNVTWCGTEAFGAALFTGWRGGKDVIAYVTASHLEPEWNGLKLYYESGQGFMEEDLMEIRDITLAGEYSAVPWNEMGSLDSLNMRAGYIDYLCEKTSLGERRLKVALDCGGGSNSLTAPGLFARLGMDVVPVFCEIDPAFSGRPSEPKPSTLGKLTETVVAGKCDFGIAFDGDGDRGVVVDDTGRVLPVDPTGIIIAREILEEHGGSGTMLANIEVSMNVEKVLEPLGASISRIRVGHTFLTLEAEKQNAFFGMEMSGHMIMPDLYLFDDAVPIPLKIAEVLSRTDRKLSELVDEIPSFPKRTTNFDCPDEIKFHVIEHLQGRLPAEYEKVNTLDGVRVDLPDGWALIRASNTSPVVRVTVEAVSEERLEELVETFCREFEDAKAKFA